MDKLYKLGVPDQKKWKYVSSNLRKVNPFDSIPTKQN